MRIFGKNEKKEQLQQIRQKLKILLRFVSFLFDLIVFKVSNSFSLDGLI